MESVVSILPFHIYLPCHLTYKYLCAAECKEMHKRKLDIPYCIMKTYVVKLEKKEQMSQHEIIFTFVNLELKK